MGCVFYVATINSKRFCEWTNNVSVKLLHRLSVASNDQAGRAVTFAVSGHSSEAMFLAIRHTLHMCYDFVVDFVL
jgi:hypothetical protein